ncbi:MAG: hypothetical protein IJC46_04765 [Clostridia bacterium]|nr:hypothetical protein [Clostridia bacterium]
MFFYNALDSRRIIHTQDCRHIKSCNQYSVFQFDTLDVARQKGFHLCSDCNPLYIGFRDELEEISKCPKYQRFHIHLNMFSIRLSSAFGDWKLVITPDGKSIRLYHKNEFETKNDAKSPVRGYHPQNVYCNTLAEYLDYILEHDWFRTLHPASPPPKEKHLPKQWGQKYKTSQKKAKKQAKRRSVQAVLQLIDSL